MAFKHISRLWSANDLIMGHVGDTAFLPGQETHNTTFGALGGLAFDTAYDMKKANLSERKMYDKWIMIWQFHIIMAFKHISRLWSAKGVIMGHMGDTAFLPGQKKTYSTFGALGGLAFYSAYDMKKANLSERKMYDK